MSLSSNNSEYSDFLEGNLSPMEEAEKIDLENDTDIKEELYLLKEINQKARSVSKYGVPTYLTESIFSEIHLSTAIGTSFISNIVKFSMAVVCLVFFNPGNLTNDNFDGIESKYEMSSGNIEINTPKEITYPITVSQEIVKPTRENEERTIESFDVSEATLSQKSNIIERYNASSYNKVDVPTVLNKSASKYSITLTQNNYSHHSNIATNERIKPFGMLGIQFKTFLSEELSFGFEIRDDNFYMLTGADERNPLGWKNTITYSAAFSYDFYETEIFGRKLETKSYYSLGLNDIGLVNRLGIGTTFQLNDFLNLNVNYEYSRLDYFLDRSTVTFSDKDNIQIGIEYIF